MGRGAGARPWWRQTASTPRFSRGLSSALHSPLHPEVDSEEAAGFLLGTSLIEK